MASSKSIIRADSLSTDRINGQADDDFILCPICANVLWKPIACKTCENAFCLKCIRLWLNEKPNVCPFNCHFQERKAPPILMKLLSKLKLDCRHKSDGCILSIPYEALEKHELHECDYRITQCPNCLEEMFKKDFDIHQKEKCLLIQLTCLKCDTIYNQSQGHTELECLKKQIITIKDKLDTSEKKPKLVEENYNKMIHLYNRQQINTDYARRTQLYNDTRDYAPSAPVYESLSSPPSQPGSATVVEISTDATSVTSKLEQSNEPLRISVISFSQIPRSKIEGGHIPNGYAGFNWENAYYMFQGYVVGKYQIKGFLNAYTKSRECVAYNSRGSSMSIFLSNTGKRFDLHSFEAISIYHENFKLSLTAYRSNIIYDTRNVILNNKTPILFEIDLGQIDKITFTPARVVDAVKPETFALIGLNLLL